MRNLIRTAVTISLMLLFTSMPRAQSQSEMNRGFCDKYRRAEAEMTKIYRQIVSGYSSDKLFIGKLRKAQRAWLIFREAHLESLYPEPNKLPAYGSVNLTCRCTALEEITRDRIKVLKQWVTGAQEGDVCSGSIKIKR